MKAVEFESEVSDDTIKIPENFRHALSKDKHVRVIVLSDDSEVDEEAEFKNTSTAEFLNAYEETDSVYDNL